MERRGIGLEVLGVPKIIPEDRTVDKLLIHFLRQRNGGGEVQRVLYPCHRPGQALVIFEEPDVAARVLHRHHVLEINGQHFDLQVKAADRPEVDIPVEATLDLSKFTDRAVVHQLLTTEGFKWTKLDRDRVRVKGYFMALTAVKAHLQMMLSSQAQPHNRHLLSSPSPILNGHTGAVSAVSKRNTDPWSPAQPVARRNSLTSPDRRLASSPASPASFSSGASGSPSSQPSPPGHSPWPAQGPDRPSQESFVTDTDVLHYAECLKKADMSVIRDRDDIVMQVTAAGPGLSEVTLSGRHANVAMGKLQSLLSDLTRTLRTQKILLSDLDHDGQVTLGQRIQKYKAIYPLVIITQENGAICMVGPSSDSFEVKQRLLGKSVVSSTAARTGRSLDKGQRARSSSLPKMRLNESRDASRATATPAGAHGYSSLKYSKDDPKGEEAGYSQMSPEPVLSGEESAGDSSEKIKKSKWSPGKGWISLGKLVPTTDFKQKLKSNNKK